MYIHTETGMLMLVAALLTMAKIWRQSTCPSTDGWINKMWYIHIMDYHSAITMNGALTCTAIWVNRENMLRERSQAQTHHVLYSIYMPSPEQANLQTKGGPVVARGWGARESWWVMVKGYGFLLE